MRNVRQNGVFFFFPRSGVERYWASCLEDGLQDLGIPTSSNQNLADWGKVASVIPSVDSATLVVGDISDMEFCRREEVDPIIRAVVAQPKRSLLLCMSDAVNTRDFPASTVVFAGHQNERVKLSGKRVPWVFGLNHNVLKKVDAALSRKQQRKPVFIRNFRPSYNQSVRQALDLTFVRNLSKHFQIDLTINDGGRFADNFYLRLSTSFGCLAYGGHFMEDLSSNQWFRERGYVKRYIVGDGPVIDRWDSWRFWEFIVSECLTVTLDFKEYGFKLPVTPEHGTYYVGLRFDQLDECLNLLNGDKDHLSEIAASGRRWALSHYAPAPTALRFLHTFERLITTG